MFIINKISEYGHANIIYIDKENKYVYIYETCSSNRCYFEGIYNKLLEILDSISDSEKKYSVIINRTEEQILSGPCGHLSLSKLIMTAKYGAKSFEYPIDKNSIIEETKLIYSLSYLSK